jgi:CelD/BcsL family acetyltransferase involved in cellulose biosynthesis
MKSVIVTRSAELERLEPEWDALYRQSTSASPFQSPHWLIPWRRHFANEAELRVLTLREHDRLVAILPLFLYGEPRRAAPVGAGISDYLDALVDEASLTVPAALWHSLWRVAEEVDGVDLHDVPLSSPLLQAESAQRVPPEPCSVCPRVVLPPAFRAYLDGLPSWLRRNIRQGESRLAKLGNVTWELAVASTFHELLDALFDLHAREWQGRGQPGVFADPRVRAFHHEAGSRLLASGALRLYGLRLDGRLLGVLYALHGRRAYQYASGIDPEYGRCNLGTLLIAHAVADAIANGLSEYDFLRGAERYKYAWQAEDDTTLRMTVTDERRVRRVA